MGDPIETNAAGEFYGREGDHLIVGSVKGNIGWVAESVFSVDSDVDELPYLISASVTATWSPRRSLHR